MLKNMQRLQIWIICLLFMMTVNTSLASAGDLNPDNVITMEEARTMALENNLTKKLNEFSWIKFREDETDTYNSINSLAYSGKTMMEINEQSNKLLDSLQSIRDNMKSREESESMDDIVTGHSVNLQYIDLLQIDKEIANSEINLTYNEKLLEVERKKYQKGMISLTELESTHTKVNQLKDSLQALKIKRESSYVKFKKLIGYPLDSEIVLQDVKAADFTLPNFAQGLENALENGLEIKLSQNDLDRKINYYNDLKSRYAQGEISGRPDLDVSEARLQLEETKTKTDLNYRTTYNSLLDTRNGLDAVVKDVKQAAKNYEQAKIKFEKGIISSLDLLAAQMEYDTKIISEDLKKYEYVRSYFAYEMARDGIITGS